ncbi:MAG TPA: hypothetical protein VGK35_04800 [Actinotalea sp.]
MSEYHLIDGPLEGHTLGSNDPHAEGEVLSIEVVDVGQELGAVEIHSYYVEMTAQPCAPGRLRLAG